MIAYTVLYELLEPFSIVWSLPPDEFHLVKEGLTKLIVKRLFEDSSTRTSKAIFTRWNMAYELCRVFTESARRTRKIATGSMKGSEFGVLVYSAFPVLVEILEDYEAGHW